LEKIYEFQSLFSEETVLLEESGSYGFLIINQLLKEHKTYDSFLAICENIKIDLSEINQCYEKKADELQKKMKAKQSLCCRSTKSYIFKFSTAYPVYLEWQRLLLQQSKRKWIKDYLNNLIQNVTCSIDNLTQKEHMVTSMAKGRQAFKKYCGDCEEIFTE